MHSLVCIYVRTYNGANRLTSLFRRVKGLKGKKAWEYQRTISDTSLTSVRSPSPTPSPTNSTSNSPTVSPIHSPRLRIPRANLATQSKTDATSNDESNLDFKSDIR